MKKRHAIAIASVSAGVVALLAGAAIAGPIIYRDAVVEPAHAVPTLDPADTASGASVTPQELQGEWRVGDGSFAGYRVREVLNGTNVTVTGRTEQVTGALTVSDAALTSASIEVDVASIATDSGSRDSYFRGTAMRAGKFPTATFELTEPVVADAIPQPGAPQRTRATGELTLAGVTRVVTVELQAMLHGTTGQVVGVIPITFTDFGVDAPKLGFVSVEDAGSVEFSLQLTRS